MYYFWLNEAQVGPYTLNQVRSMWGTGQINATTYYWQEGMAGWTSLAEIVPLIEEAPSMRETPKVFEVPRPQAQVSLPLNSLYPRVLYFVFGLAIIAFFLPNISITLPIVGNENASMLDLLTSKPTGSGSDASSTSDANSQTPTPNIWDAISANKASVGGIICAVSVILLLGHYILTVIWGIVTFALRRSYSLLTFLWLALAVQFPILFLIGGQLLIGGIKSQMSSDLSGNPFAALGTAMIASVKVQPGLVTWFLMVISVASLALWRYLGTQQQIAASEVTTS